MINELKYLSKTTDIFIFISDLESSISENLAHLKATNLKIGVIELIKDPKIWVNQSVPSNEKLDQITEDIYKKGYAKVINYKKWILGYGLVMLWGIFESYLEDLLIEILDANPNLLSWSTKNEIVEKFRNGTFEDKFKIFKNKLNFSEKEFFDFTIYTLEIQKKLGDYDFNKANEIYKKRNKVAHSDSYVIYNVAELALINDLIEKLIWNLSIKTRKKWNIKSELIELVKKQSK